MHADFTDGSDYQFMLHFTVAESARLILMMQIARVKTTISLPGDGSACASLRRADFRSLIRAMCEAGYPPTLTGELITVSRKRGK
jgi:hypothetical protein